MIEALILYGLWLGALGIVGAVLERYPNVVKTLSKWVTR